MYYGEAMGSLRSLMCNPAAKKNQPKKIKRSWRGLLARQLRKKIPKQFPHLFFKVEPHYLPHKFVRIEWKQPVTWGSKYRLSDVKGLILEIIHRFAAKRDLVLSVNHLSETSCVVTRWREE